MKHPCCAPVLLLVLVLPLAAAPSPDGEADLEKSLSEAAQAVLKITKDGLVAMADLRPELEFVSTCLFPVDPCGQDREGEIHHADAQLFMLHEDMRFSKGPHSLARVPASYLLESL